MQSYTQNENKKKMNNKEALPPTIKSVQIMKESNTNSFIPQSNQGTNVITLNAMEKYYLKEMMEGNNEKFKINCLDTIKKQKNNEFQTIPVLRFLQEPGYILTILKSLRDKIHQAIPNQTIQLLINSSVYPILFSVEQAQFLLDLYSTLEEVKKKKSLTIVDESDYEKKEMPIKPTKNLANNTIEGKKIAELLDPVAAIIDHHCVDRSFHDYANFFSEYGWDCYCTTSKGKYLAILYLNLGLNIRILSKAFNKAGFDSYEKITSKTISISSGDKIGKTWSCLCVVLPEEGLPNGKLFEDYKSKIKIIIEEVSPKLLKMEKAPMNDYSMLMSFEKEAGENYKDGNYKSAIRNLEILAMILENKLLQDNKRLNNDEMAVLLFMYAGAKEGLGDCYSKTNNDQQHPIKEIKKCYSTAYKAYYDACKLKGILKYWGDSNKVKGVTGKLMKLGDNTVSIIGNNSNSSNFGNLGNSSECIPPSSPFTFKWDHSSSDLKPQEELINKI